MYVRRIFFNTPVALSYHTMTKLNLEKYPEHLYHATPTENLHSIMKEGLKPPLEGFQSVSLGENHTNRVFLSKFSDPKEMYLPSEKMDDPLAVLRIETKDLEMEECGYPDDALYNAYFNDDLSVDELKQTFPEIAEKCRGLDDDGWMDCFEEYEPTNEELETMWKGKGYFTVNGISQESIVMGEMGYQCSIPPENIGVHSVDMFHGTCPDSAEKLLNDGWKPNEWMQGGNLGKRDLLYLASDPKNARWFANEKGCDVVLKVRNIPMDRLTIDPEDCVWCENAEKEMEGKYGFNLALKEDLSAEHFRLYREKVTIK